MADNDTTTNEIPTVRELVNGQYERLSKLAAGSRTSEDMFYNAKALQEIQKADIYSLTEAAITAAHDSANARDEVNQAVIDAQAFNILYEEGRVARTMVNDLAPDGDLTPWSTWLADVRDDVLTRTLPSNGAILDGSEIIIKDRYGRASNNAINIAGPIEDVADDDPLTISSDYGWVWLRWMKAESKWIVIAGAV
ncbi:MAG: hypothetical protein CMF37_14845 [Leeuwenhoekiella sp.]|nr:hypothetical protein [Leeuwenhoekiella sp.]MBQ50108.1 hypothetical protein [Leeuwenhoekiella sp.]MBQ50305.1 hypothetical protein [Leeuwenhoekiella sp.]MBQ50502.1 hypothetical protein [Leeuwenhoekiella sp.]|tara:strand:+ start:8009 stop:8593 length:585 start_codon:yes stop_codon:yes gene_type:complete